ncbi:hypothetical protein IJM86_05990 [bacterium]|nr:hypothetical protein [bacterium]
MKKCEVEKLKSFLAYDPLYIDKALVYATVLGLETEVIKKLQSVMQENTFFKAESFTNLESLISHGDSFDLSQYRSRWAVKVSSSSPSYDRSS